MGIFSGGRPSLTFQFITEYILDVLNLIIFGKPSYTENDIKGKIVIVTGANSGIGKSTVYEMAKRGATVIMACRNLTEGKKAMVDIRSKFGVTGHLDLLPLDLGDLESIKKFAQIINTKYKKVDVLVNNAGHFEFDGKLSKTKDGFEPHMGVNHLGHFLLVKLLKKALENGSPSRVVVVSSTLQLFNSLDLDDLMLVKIGIVKGYSNSKFANSLFAKELGKKLAGSGVTTYSVCPGAVKTPITRNLHWTSRWFWNFVMFFFGFSPSQGCQTIVYCALCREIEGESGKFYRLFKSFEPVNRILKDEMAEKLWKLSEELVHDRKYTQLKVK